ncbi:MAG: MFS transporter [Parvibaculaceae bacterium]|nr:MFS transporter [Parvibaculaceae bacterium]
MLSVLSHPTYRKLFFAQVVALLGTGLTTIALGLLAYELAGAQAGAVLGTALAIKMCAYVGVAPIANAFTSHLPRRAVLISLDVIRAAIVCVLPFVTEVWQIYLLIFALQSASAAFTPTFQATIPDILPEEQDYTKALSLSRLAYDLENLLSPMVAAALLAVVSFHVLFVGTAFSFLVSAVLVFTCLLPISKLNTPELARPNIIKRITKGIRLYLNTPRLRGLLAINVSVAAASAIVIVNTVVYVQFIFGLGTQETALAFAAFGAGSMGAALALPRVLEKMPDRTVMLIAALVLTGGAAASGAMESFESLLLLWFVLGLGFSAAQTPAGRLLKRSASRADGPDIFTAQFSLSHACWLITYPIAGWVGAWMGLSYAAYLLAALCALGCVAALFLWPSNHKEITR